MLVITSDIKSEIDAKVLEIALEILRAGGVIAYATDTCYGFSCDVTNKAAVDRLRYLKKMPPTKPVSLLFANLEMMDKWVCLNKPALSLAAANWPGSLTLILPKKADFPSGLKDYANIAHAKLGCRIPSCVFSHRLVEKMERPIASTSANISGLPQSYSGYELLAQYQNADLKPDLLIDSGLRPNVKPSTILDLSLDEPVVLRQGEVMVL